MTKVMHRGLWLVCGMGLVVVIAAIAWTAGSPPVPRVGQYVMAGDHTVGCARETGDILALDPHQLMKVMRVDYPRDRVDVVMVMEGLSTGETCYLNRAFEESGRSK
jgi:hypothetical protein